MAQAASLYRRHRPQAFAEVVGQEHVVRTLSNAVERDRVHHAYLFVGSRGTGKTSLAKILARSLNCVEGPTLTPCGVCDSCVSIAAGTSIDVIEMDAASNRSVDDIRELRERVGFVPAAGRSKVYILDEAHMLTREAWNAFLKTLEEPPPSTVFILATTEPHKVMPTIVDRCQRFDFQRPSPEQIAEVLRRVAAAEQLEIADGAVGAIARAASGSFRDALGTLDQLVAYSGTRIETADVLAVLGVADAELILAAADAIAAGDGRAAIEVGERLARSGHDVTQFARDLLAHLRHLLILRTAGEAVGDQDLAAADPERMLVQADAFTDLGLGRAIDVVAAALTAIREGDEPRMTFELALLRAARPQIDPSREAFAQRLERVEHTLAGGDPPASAAPAREAAEPKAEMSHAAAPVEPEPSEPSPAPAGEGVFGLDQLVSLWPAVMDEIRGHSELMAHALSVARPVGMDGEAGVVAIGFPASSAFNRRKAESAEGRELIARSIRTITGHSVRVRCETSDHESDPGPAAAMSEDELVDRLKAEFGAEEIALEEVTEQVQAGPAEKAPGTTTTGEAAA